MKLLLFDIDGTLLLSGGAGKIAIEKAFEILFNLPGVWGDLVPDGKTDPIIFSEIAMRVLKRELSGEEAEQLYALYLEHFHHALLNSPRFSLMPGVLDILEVLSGIPGLFLGVATGNFEDAAWAKLERGRIRHYFKCGGFGSDSKDRYELTAKAVLRAEALLGSKMRASDIIVIGDSVHDIAAGKKLGAVTVAVATGQTPKTVLLAQKPDFLLQDLSDKELLLKVLHG